MMRRQPLLTPHWLARLLSDCSHLTEGYTSLTLLPGDHERPNWRATLHWTCACPSVRCISRSCFIFLGSGMCWLKEEGEAKGGGNVRGRKIQKGGCWSRERKEIRGEGSEKIRGCRKRREGHERGGLRVQGKQERREEKEVLGDLIIRLKRKCCISNISAWKWKLSWQEKKKKA